MNRHLPKLKSLSSAECIFSFAVPALALALSGCGGGGGDGANGRTALVSMAALSAGATCVTGGTTVNVGLDLNGDGVLDASEITSTKSVCNGATGAAGTNGTNGVDGAGAPGTPGTNGTNGAPGTPGTNGTNGSPGANGVSALLSLIAEPVGANCVNGGTRVDAGADTNANSVLDASEITSTKFICNGASAAWVSVTADTKALSSNTNYVVNYTAGLASTLALPANPAVGDTIGVIGGQGGWKFSQSAGQSILVGDVLNVKSTATTFASTIPFAKSWNPIATNQTGQKIVAAGDFLYASQDFGATWSTILSTSRNWRGVAMSSYGANIVAVADNGEVWRSVDSGGSWTMTNNGGANERVAMSADGQTVLIAQDGGGSVLLSTDAGVTYSTAPVTASGRWVSASMSSDGQRMVVAQNATVGFNVVSMSLDGGATWSSPTVPAGTQQVSISGDGKTLVGLTYNGTDNAVYISKDLGVTWIKAVSASQGNMLRLAVSSNGQAIVAGLNSGLAYVSFDGGLDWSTQGNGGTSWYGVAVSVDGEKAFIADPNSGAIYKATIPLASPDSSTVGVSGGLSGGKYSGATLQYIGGGSWLMINSVGPTFTH